MDREHRGRAAAVTRTGRSLRPQAGSDASSAAPEPAAPAPSERSEPSLAHPSSPTPGEPRRITAGQRPCHSDVTPGTVNCSRPGGSYGRHRRGRWPQRRRGARRNDSRGKREGQGTRWVTVRAGAPPRSRSGPRRTHPRAASRRGQGRGRRRPWEGGRRRSRRRREGSRKRGGCPGRNRVGRRLAGRLSRRRAGRRPNRGRQRPSGGRQVPRCGRRRARSGRRRARSGPRLTGRRETDRQRTGGRRTLTGRRLTRARTTDTRPTGTRPTDTPGTGTRAADTPGTGTPGTGTPGTGTWAAGTRGTARRWALGTHRVPGGGQETTDGGPVRDRPVLVRPRPAPRMRLRGLHSAPDRKEFAREVPVTQRVRRLPARRLPQVQGLLALLPQNGARKG